MVTMSLRQRLSRQLEVWPLLFLFGGESPFHTQFGQVVRSPQEQSGRSSRDGRWQALSH